MHGTYTRLGEGKKRSICVCRKRERERERRFGTDTLVVTYTLPCKEELTESLIKRNKIMSSGNVKKRLRIRDTPPLTTTTTESNAL